ncbi:MAG: prolyl oligopeptidase family serine peptidase [Gemmataceae bacterium]
MAKKGYVDEKHVGISGHSYGGYMSGYALTHGKVFTAGIASGPVTDWALYDSIYTERYMGLPSENRKGTAIFRHRRGQNLHGKLMIMHGMIDDNVHVQNSMQLIDALEQANKPFEMMVYPRNRHGIGGPHSLADAAGFHPAGDGGG